MVDLQPTPVTVEPARIPAQRRSCESMTQAVTKPWGWYTVVGLADERPIAAVKTIVVEPGQALSLQTHSLRTERWLPLSFGLAAMIGGERHELLPNHVYDIGIGVPHRLFDECGTGGSVLEVMYGHYDEDDIVRLADRYQRM